MSLKIVKKFNPTQVNFLFKLRNKKYVRNSSLSKKKINFVNHESWISKFRKNKKNRIYIIHKNNIKIGYIRIRKEKVYSNVSWAIEKKFQNKGIMSKELFKVTSRKSQKFKCLIKKNNFASIKVANNAKFIFKMNLNKNLMYTKN